MRTGFPICGTLSGRAAAAVATALVAPPLAVVADVVLPPAGGAPDYQLGAPYPPMAGVTVVASAAIVAVVTEWIHGCAEKGYDAVEFDNLDGYDRSAGALRRDDALALARVLVATAHEAGLAAAQKNAAADSGLFRSAGFDFAVAEECAAYPECNLYTEVYGGHVIDIEYTDNLPRDFASICDEAASPASVVLRDRDLVAPPDPQYHFELCP